MKLFHCIYIVPLIAGVLLMVSFLSNPQQTKEQYVYEPSLGKVTFSHLKHQERLKTDCQTCHHESCQETPPEACSNCHKKIVQIMPLGEAITLSNAFHTRCIGCHQDKLKEDLKPPVKCQECHIKQEEKIKPD